MAVQRHIFLDVVQLGCRLASSVHSRDVYMVKSWTPGFSSILDGWGLDLFNSTYFDCHLQHSCGEPLGSCQGFCQAFLSGVLIENSGEGYH